MDIHFVGYDYGPDVGRRRLIQRGIDRAPMLRAQLLETSARNDQLFPNLASASAEHDVHSIADTRRKRLGKDSTPLSAIVGMDIGGGRRGLGEGARKRVRKGKRVQVRGDLGVWKN